MSISHVIFRPRGDALFRAGENGKQRDLMNIHISGYDGCSTTLSLVPEGGHMVTLAMTNADLAEFVRMLQSHLAES